MNIENEYLKQIIGEKKGVKFDVIVMYTGGKDSAYLIYLLKEVYMLRVLAVTVDNGYEFNTSNTRMKKYLNNVDVPLEVIKPEKSFFTKLYRELIINPKNLLAEGRNHICHVCNNIIWMSVCKFASDNKIPYIASGLSFEQLNSGRKRTLSIDAISNTIAEKSTKLINKQIMDYLFSNDEFISEKEYIQLSEYFNNKDKYRVTTIYPFIYHRVSVDNLKKTVIEYGDWTPPVDVPVEKYVSSGCQIMNKVLFELEKLEMVKLNEREEAKRMLASGLINKERASFAERDVTKEKVDLSDEIFDDLCIKEYLMNIAKKRNQL